MHHVVAGAVVRARADAVDHRVAHVDVAARPCRSSRAARGRRPGTRPRACGGTGRGSPRPGGCGTGCRVPGSVSVPRYSRDLVGRQVVDVGLARRGSAARRSRRAARSSRRRRRAARPSRSRASARRRWMDSTYSTSSLVGLVSSKRRLQLPPKSCGDAEVQADRLGVADVQVAVGLGREARCTRPPCRPAAGRPRRCRG